MSRSWLMKKLRGKDSGHNHHNYFKDNDSKNQEIKLMKDRATSNVSQTSGYRGVQNVPTISQSSGFRASQGSSSGNLVGNPVVVSASTQQNPGIRGSRVMSSGAMAARAPQYHGPSGTQAAAIQGGWRQENVNEVTSRRSSVLSGSPGCSSASGLATGRMYVAQYDYDARTEHDLSFRKCEHLEVLEESSDGWWYARSHVTDMEGYIPATYVAKLKSIEAEEWYFGEIRRVEAERLLLSKANDHGAFLIRDSESRKSEFSLSVRDGDKVHHYRIRPIDHGGFFIGRNLKFSSLHEMVSSYSEDASGLCTRLKKPCVKQDKPTTVGLSFNTWDTWEIPKEQIELQIELGAGHFGKVYRGLWNKTVPVAVKTLITGKMQANEFLAEAQFLKKLRHPKLLQLYGVCTLQEPFFIVTELMQNGSLLNYLRDRTRRINFTDQIYIGAQVAAGMEYLEESNYIHRDLAARNVLVGEDNTVKVADFGLSRLVQDEEYEAHEGAKFPIKWTAPEALNYNRFSTKSDVWSFGILLMEIITNGMTPYPAMTNSQVANEIDRGYRMPQPRQCPDRLYKIMLETWAKDPNKRPTFYTLRWYLEDYFHLDDTEYVDAEP